MYQYQYDIFNRPKMTFHEKKELVKQLIKLKIRGTKKMAKSKSIPKKPPMPKPGKKGC